MKPAQDTAMKTKTTPGVRSYAHRPRGAVLVLVLAASLMALLPNAAYAQGFVTGATGVGGAEVNITPDGYNEPFHLNGRTYTVEGRNFLAADDALIFQCPVTRQAALTLECQPLGVGQTDSSGYFTAEVYMDDMFVSVLRPGACFGRAYTNIIHTSVQCSVVAVTFDRNNPTLVNKMAEHYICFEGMFRGTGQYDAKCVNQ